MAVSQKNLYHARTKQVSSETLDNVQVHLNRAIEAVWLTAAFLVPLIVLSEHDFTSITELPKIALVRSLAGTGLILWLINAAVGLAKNALPEAPASDRKAFSVRDWAFTHPIEFSATLILAVTGISALLSIQPTVSFLGAEWGRDGYDLHTTASYLVLFFLAASRIRNHDQIVRLWATISIAGLIAGLIGIAQHFALAPFGISGTYQHQRVTGTVGNPLFLGALLTVTMPMGIALAIAGATGAVRPFGRWLGESRIWWGALALTVFITIYAALLTASRGPWIGMAAGLVVLVALSAKSLGMKNTALTVVSISAGLGLALMIAIGPASSGIESFAVSEQQQLFDERQAQGSGATIVGTEPADASSVIAGRGKQGTVEARLKIWAATRDVAFGRPSLPESNNMPWVVRQAFGYGPDTFRFVFPIEAPADFMDTLTSSAHNDPLNRLVEIGVAGLLAYGLLLIATWFVIWRLISRGDGKRSILVVALAVGVGSAIAGRIVEQMSGVAEVSDTTVIWLALALLASAYAINLRTHRESATESADNTASPARRMGLPIPSVPPALAFSAVAVGIALAGYFIWAHNVNLIRSDMAFKSANSLLTSDLDLGLDRMQSAVRLNPGVEDYRHVIADIYQARAEQNVSLAQRSDWLQAAYDQEAEAYSFNPTSRSANFELAFASWQLAQLGSNEKALETLQTYERLSELAPNHPLVIERLAQLQLAVGSNAPR